MTKNYTTFDVDLLKEFIKSDDTPSDVKEILGLVVGKSDLEVSEVGDGNMNYVYTLKGPRGSLIAKQAVPYIRMVGESWPLTEDRAHFEAQALKAQFRSIPQHVPQLFYSNRSLCLNIIQYLPPPHIVLRKGLIQGIIYPYLSEHLSDFLAYTLFTSSSLCVKTSEKRKMISMFSGNYELCKTTEQVVFTDPYYKAPLNRHTSPQLDDLANELIQNSMYKLAISLLKQKFQENTEALIHGDFHTGSVMVTEDTTYAIDPEFAFYGPMGFDIGALIGNFYLSYYSQEGHKTDDNNRIEYKQWILDTVEEIWGKFLEKFVDLWKTEHRGDLYAPSYMGPEALDLAQRTYMTRLFDDTLGFAAAKMIRRIVGVAHVEDMESITDINRKAICERKALQFAMTLILNKNKFTTIQEITALVKNFD